MLLMLALRIRLESRARYVIHFELNCEDEVEIFSVYLLHFIHATPSVYTYTNFRRKEKFYV